MATSFDFRSSDGTVLRGWTNDADGPPLVISNGLGAVPLAWPSLVAPDSGFRTTTWFHRGTFGSARPADPSRVRVEHHVDDMTALLDARAIDRALVACWSLGVNVAFELAKRHPDRVSGLLAVAGVPGGSFDTMGGPLRIPRRLRRPLAVGAARSGRLVGPPLTWLASRVPVDERIAWLLRHSGFMLPAARQDVLVPMLQEYLAQDWSWYLRLAAAASEHTVMDLEFVRCPTTVLAGRHDALTSMHDVLAVAARIPHAEVSVLPGSHFLALEHPEQVLSALRHLLARTEHGPATTTRVIS